MYVRLPDDYKIDTISPDRMPASPAMSTADLAADADCSDSPVRETLSQPPQPDTADVDTSAASSQAVTVSVV